MLFSILFSLLLSEVILHFIDLPIAKDPHLKQWRCPSDTLGWELIPHLKEKGNLGVNIEINSHGLRDVERSWSKKEEYRILALGDSFTYGYALELKDTYVKQIENLLKADKKNTDVINAGVIGYNLYQSLTYFKNKGIKYDPDLVIYFFWIDDVGSTNSPEEIKKLYNVLLQSDECKKVENKIISKFYISNLLKNLQVLIDTRLRPLTSADWLRSINHRKQTFAIVNENYLSGTYNLEPFKKHMTELKNTTQKINAKLFVVLIPDSVQVNNPPMQKMNQILRNICLDNQIFFLDITPLFEKESDIASLYLFPLDAHTSAKGNRIIANAVYKKIQNLFNLQQ